MAHSIVMQMSLLILMTVISVDDERVGPLALSYTAGVHLMLLLMYNLLLITRKACTMQ